MYSPPSDFLPEIKLIPRNSFTLRTPSSSWIHADGSSFITLAITGEVIVNRLFDYIPDFFQVESIRLYSSKQPIFPTTSADYCESDYSLAMSLFGTFSTGTTRGDTNVYDLVQNCVMAIPTAG